MTDTPQTALASAEVKPIDEQALRCTDPKLAHSMIHRRALQLNKFLPRYEMIEADYDRAPPEENDETYGVGDAVRVNWGGMKAAVDEATLVDFNLTTQPETYVRLGTDSVTQGIGNRLAEIEKEHKKIVDGWKGAKAQLGNMVFNRRAHGYGIYHFPRPLSWHWKSLHPRDLIYPIGASLDVAEWPWFAVRTEFKTVDLLAKIGKSAGKAGELGWQVESIKKVIQRLKDAGDVGRDVQLDLATAADDGRDLFFADAYGDAVKGYQFYVKEFDGAVSEYFITHGEDDGFIFKGERRHKSMTDTLHLFPLAIGKGDIKALRGIGMEMLPFFDVENLARNRFISDWLTTGGTVLQGQGDDDLHRLAMEMKTYGGLTLLPTGLSLAATQFPDTTRRGMEVLREIQGAGNQRQGALGGVDASQRTPDQTATAARLIHQQNQGAESNEVDWFMGQLTEWYQVSFWRIWKTKKDAPGGKEVAEAYARLAAIGVTTADFEAISEVKARSAFGDGNPRNVFLALMDLRPDVGAYPESGKQLFRYEVAKSVTRDAGMARELTGYGGPVDNLAINEKWRAQVENNSFETSDTKQDLGANDNHFVHLEVLTTWAEDTIKRRDGGALSEADAFARLNRAKPHAQAHLQAFSQDVMMRQAFEVFLQRWSVLENEMRKMEQHLTAENEKRQAQQMEEMRTPQISVKDKELSMTEEFKRQLMAKEHERKMAMMEREHAVKSLQHGGSVPVMMDEFGRPIE